VHLPYAYHRSNMNYPVLYSLDGDDVSRFSKSAATLEELNSSGKIPKMILITVADADRIPIRLDSDPDSAEALDFLKFLADELILFVNENYRTADYRVLFGQSNAGLFTVYSLLERPESFDAYIASSPMLGWCSDFIFRKAEDLFEENKALDNFLFMIYGEDDYERVTSYVPDFAELLKSKAPPDFEWRMKALDDEGHVLYTSLYDGLRGVFSDWVFAKTGEKQIELPEIIDFYSRLTAKYGFHAQIPFGLLLDVGMSRLREGEIEDAIRVFEVGAEEYPYYGGAYYYLAEACRRGNKAAPALENYRKALEVDPEYPRRETILRRIEGLQ
jgi:tetratricopeptide (TPR) repeat protein